jgi:hypothetical protein
VLFDSLVYQIEEKEQAEEFGFPEATHVLYVD